MDLASNHCATRAKIVRYVLTAVLGLLATTAGHSQSGQPAGRELPPFLAPYFRDAIDAVGKDLTLRDHQAKDNLTTYTYGSPDQVAGISLESFNCERDRCQVLYQNGVQFFNKMATENSGRFTHATLTETTAQWQTGLANTYSFIAKLPNSVLIASYSERLDRHADIGAFLSGLKAATDHQRYEQVRKTGEALQAGIWSGAIHDYARALLTNGNKDEAVEVLKLLVAGAPYDYEAHGELIDNASDPAVARASAAVVYDNAEDELLIEKAGHTLGKPSPEFSKLPVLEKDDGGLHVVLLVLPPCNLILLSEAARLYENLTGIPVSIRRLPEPWDSGDPVRIPDQRAIQRELIQQRGPNTDFTGWDSARYKNELLKTVESSDALRKFSMESFVTKLNSRPPQYNASDLSARLASIMWKYRSQDTRVLYVAVTGLDIFLGDTNFVFSAGSVDRGIPTIILSYNRMTAKVAGDRFESRKRVATRLAKQLVPPTLRSLGIPRPTDPTDPYSYADSIQRVDEATLMLSTPTKEALDKLR
jgi:predicted Zn-dependent protease